MRNRHIILIGHRKQHGKDTVGNMMHSALSSAGVKVEKTMFAKMLKEQTSVRYNLDFDQMDSDEYKNSKPSHLGGLSVRDVLIREGRLGRSIWNLVWANSGYRDIILSDRFSELPEVGIITDFRFPNEYDGYDEILKSIGVSNTSYKIHKVLVHRPGGPMVDDGCDSELPDLEGMKDEGGSVWDYIIVNYGNLESWQNNLKVQVEDFLNKFILEK